MLDKKTWKVNNECRKLSKHTITVRTVVQICPRLAPSLASSFSMLMSVKLQTILYNWWTQVKVKLNQFELWKAAFCGRDRDCQCTKQNTSRRVPSSGVDDRTSHVRRRTIFHPPTHSWSHAQKQESAEYTICRFLASVSSSASESVSKVSGKKNWNSSASWRSCSSNRSTSWFVVAWMQRYIQPPRRGGELPLKQIYSPWRRTSTPTIFIFDWKRKQKVKNKSQLAYWQQLMQLTTPLAALGYFVQSFSLIYNSNQNSAA